MNAQCTRIDDMRQTIKSYEARHDRLERTLESAKKSISY